MPAPTLASAQAALLRGIASHDDAAEPLDALVRGDTVASAGARVGVYAHAYFERIRKCLADDFPALEKALGPGAFHDLVKLYLMAFSPRHWSLRYAGDRLAEFAGAHPAAEAIRRRCAFAGDLAALEFAILEAFDAPDAASLQRAVLAATPPEDWNDLVLVAAPGLQRLALAWPVQRLREAHESGAAPPPLEPQPTLLGVWREAERVYFRALEPDEADALAGLLAGEPFGALCERIERHVGAEQVALRATALLERWLSDFWLASA